jgi:hypothetical protein
MIESLIEGEKLRREMEMAQVVQMSTLPQAMPVLAGYDVHGTFRPALLTGGDTFDLAPVGDGLLVVLGDATGHGIAPAMSVTQMHAMLRMAFRLGADLETAFAQVNDLLAETLAADRFVTALHRRARPAPPRRALHQRGQGPILHFHASAAACSRHKPTSFPLGAMALPKPRGRRDVLAPGDVLVLLSDGIYEYAQRRGEAFGEARVEEVVARPTARLDGFAVGGDSRGVQAFAAARARKTTSPSCWSGARRRRERECRVPLAHRRLSAIVAFTTAAFERQGAPPSCGATSTSFSRSFSPTSSKYGRGTARWRRHRGDRRRRRGHADRAEAERFDVTRAPPVDTTLPAESRGRAASACT